MHVFATAVIPLFVSLINLVATLPPLNYANNNLLLASSETQNLTSLQALNVTTSNSFESTSPANKIRCYEKGHRSTPVDLLTCFPLIADLSSEPDFDKVVKWPVSRSQIMYKRMGGCMLQIIDGATSDVFSFADMVEAMEAVRHFWVYYT